MDARLRHGFRIGGFEVEPLTGQITGPSGTQRVQPKVMDVLLYLAGHAGELVERNTLLTDVWKRITSEEVLTRCISELRRALDDDRAQPTFIQTVPKRGYRLVGQVIVRDLQAAPAAAGPSTEPSPGTPPAPHTAIAAVAVLPFDNHSAEPARQFMGEAFAAELHGTLARVDRLRVAARRSSFVFKSSNLDVREIGMRLNVDYVISGSVQCNGPRLRIVAELNDAKEGVQLWAQRYDRRGEDLFAIEKEIAEAIVSSFSTHQLRVEIASARHAPTASLDAWGLVQKARAYLLDYTAESLAAAIEPLRRAIELDREYAAAHAALSWLLAERLLSGWSSEPEQDGSSGLASAREALALAPRDPLVLKLTTLSLTYAGEHRKALSNLRAAVSYAPFDLGAWGYMGWPLTASGDAAELAELRGILDRLLTTEPNHPGSAFWLYHTSAAHTLAGDYAGALESIESALELKPRFALGWIHCANVLGHLKQRERAHHALAQSLAANPQMTPDHFASVIARITANEGVAQHRVGGLRGICALAPQKITTAQKTRRKTF